MKIQNSFAWKKVAGAVSRRKAGILFLLLPLFATLQVQGQAFQLRKINPPGTNYSYAFGINNKGNRIVGSFQDSKGGFEGYVFNWVSYTNVVYPGSVNYTGAFGVNNARTVVGDFLGADTATHGYLLSSTGTYTQYDVPGKISTSIYGINDHGSLVGIAGFNGDNQGFVDIGGTVTLFSVEGETTYAFGINNTNSVVGVFLPPPDFLQHGFIRAADGTITEINYPGAQFTYPEGINDQGVVSGYYVDHSDVAHGFTYKDGTFKVSRLPNINRMNNQGVFVGSYPFGAGNNFGYVASPSPE